MPQVIILTGPSGAGKTTTAKKLAETLDGTWALLSQDGTRALIKAGFADPEVVWNDETQKQWDLTIDICCDTIRHFYNAGYNVIIELFAPPTEFEKWKSQLTKINYKLFVLLPSVEETVSRNANRSRSMNEAQVRENHEWFTKWQSGEATIINTSDHSLDKSMSEIKKHLNLTDHP